MPVDEFVQPQADVAGELRIPRPLLPEGRGWRDLLPADSPAGWTWLTSFAESVVALSRSHAQVILTKVGAFLRVCGRLVASRTKLLDGEQRACDPAKGRGIAEESSRGERVPATANFERPYRRPRKSQRSELRTKEEDRQGPMGVRKGATSLSIKECEQQATAIQSGAY